MRFEGVSRTKVRAVLLLIVVGFLWFGTRGPEPTAAPKMRVVVEEGAPMKAQPLATFKRPAVPTLPVPRVASAPEPTPVDAPVIPVPKVRLAPPTQIDLDDLDPALRLELGENAMGQLRDLAESCDPYATFPVNAVARVTVDPDGLLEMALNSYGESPDLPIELQDCLEEVLWDQAWVGAPDGTELRFELSLRMGLDEDE